MIDPATQTVLDSRTLSSFVSGDYLVWNLRGHVQLVFTNEKDGTNAVVSGLFFGGHATAAAPPTVTTPANAAPNPATGTTTTLNVLAPTPPTPNRP